MELVPWDREDTWNEYSGTQGMNRPLCKIYLTDTFYCVLNAYIYIPSVNMLKTIFND